jgi:hypothetical protein
MVKPSDSQAKLNSLQKSVKDLEERISRLESVIRQSHSVDESEFQPLLPGNIEEVTENLEFQIGQFWFAKAGIMVLAIELPLCLSPFW